MTHTTQAPTPDILPKTGPSMAAVLRRSYAHLQAVQQQLDALTLAEPAAASNNQQAEDAAPAAAQQARECALLVQQAERLTRQVLAIEKVLRSPAVLSAATLPFLEWLAAQDPQQAATYGEQYNQWLASLS